MEKHTGAKEDIDFEHWTPLRATKSENQIRFDDSFQSERISALLNEMKPVEKKANTTNIVNMNGVKNAIYGSWQDRKLIDTYGSQEVIKLPKYDQLYCKTTGASSMNSLSKKEPPDYNRLVNTRPKSIRQMTTSETRSTHAGWLKNSRPLNRGALSPAGYFHELETQQGSVLSTPTVLSIAAVKLDDLKISNKYDKLITTASSSSESTLDSATGNSCKTKKNGNCEMLTRNTPRQASFMAAVAKNPLKENSQSNTSILNTADDSNKKSSVNKVIETTPIRRPKENDSISKRLSLRKSMGFFDFDLAPCDRKISKNCKNKEEEMLKTRTFPKRATGSSNKSEKQNCNQELSGSADSKNDEAMKMIRRARPKSYVLATSVSMQENEIQSIEKLSEKEPTSSSHDDTSGQEIIETTSSIERRRTIENVPQTARSLNAPHPPATHRLQRFIALFNTNKNNDSEKKKYKRSRTSLPASRFSLSGTIVQRETIDRQTWVKHQENALGKSGKRNQWEERWAILAQRILYLCVESATVLSDKAVELGVHTKVDVKNAIVDIAYDWLSATLTKQRHVVRIVTQNRSEHLIELNTESEMLSWISVLQSSSEDSVVTGSSGSDEIVIKLNNKRETESSNNFLHNSYSIASLASSSCSTTTSELVTSTTTTNTTTAAAAAAAASTAAGTETATTLNVPKGSAVNELKEIRNQQLSTSKSCAGGFSTFPDSVKNQLIMHRYLAKNTQLQSPIASSKRTDNSGFENPSEYVSNAGTSKESSENVGIDSSMTPKSGRKWKKSKAAKQSSSGAGSNYVAGGGATSSGSSSGSQHGYYSGNSQPVLGVKLADCPVGSFGEHVPMMVQICVSVVEAHGMDTVGIYRIPGNTAAVNALKESLSNRGLDNVNPKNIESLDPRWRDVNVVSSLLKMFLRKLPEPLLTDKLYPFFIDANRIAIHHNRLHKLRNLLRKLPRPHYDTLRFLITHLAEITKHSGVNKMECRNLALMFGPSIVRPSDDNMATMVTHMSDQCKIIETLIHYNIWMFDETSTMEDPVPEQHPSDGQNPLEPGLYGVGVPTGVSAASFNDMHNLIRKANEDQAAAMMNEGKGTKIKNMLRRNSRRDKSKGKLRIESTAPAAVNPKWTQPTPSTTSATSVESAFCGSYQERDIDAEIESRLTTFSPQQTSGSVDEVRLDQSPSLESSLGSLPDTSRTEPTISTRDFIDDEAEEELEERRKRRQMEMYSARRIFIAGSEANRQVADEKAAIDALANHSQHLHLASSPAFEVLSEETREKIRIMQKKQSWHDNKEMLKTSSLPTKDLVDALSCTSDYSTTSSAPQSSINPSLAVACEGGQNSSSDYASSDPSPCARNPSTSPASRPSNLVLSSATESESTTPPTTIMHRSQKIRMRTKPSSRDASRRHTLPDMDVLKHGKLDKLVKWFGIRKSSPDVSRDEQENEESQRKMTIIQESNNITSPPEIVKTSPNELTPVSGDEQL